MIEMYDKCGQRCLDEVDTGGNKKWIYHFEPKTASRYVYKVLIAAEGDRPVTASRSNTSKPIVVGN